MEENKKYYTLRYERTDGQHKAGERIAASAETVRIGQQEDCDVRFANDTDFADETFAVIRPCKDTGGWQLVACSEFVITTVNGTAVRLVHYLDDGDRISFEGERQELLFNIHSDSKYNADGGTVVVSAPVSRKLELAIFAILFILICIIGGYSYQIKNADRQRTAVIDSMKQSVMQISVDSVYYVERSASGTRIIGTYSYEQAEEHSISGTAFLTEDSLLITARHCIEPWLNDGTIMGANKPKDLKSLPTRWALEAETYNQTHDGDTTYLVVSVCRLYRGEKATDYVATYKSTDFSYDQSRDNIIEKGDFYNVYYWRSIQCGHTRRDMMLGDIASVKHCDKGRISIAKDDDMKGMLRQGQRLDFIGYPSYIESGMEPSEGEVKLEYHNTGDEMIAHNGGLKSGYSGAPALVVKGQSAYAVGVVSVTDEGGDRIYSVPITEINKKGGRQ